ncbi:MAG: hypothetical protein ONA90_02655 [candidate division KSB1 bacterium]|nr:hypothetical protein [candidate division KSB1 bacterium]
MNCQATWWRILVFFVPAALFLCGTLPHLELPGIQYDEVYYVPPAAALLKHQYDMDYVMLNPSVIHIGGRPLPVMFNYYTSFFRTYLTLPVFALFGINVYTIRLSSIALGTMALIFFVAFARRLTNRSEIALASGIFLALDASFIAYTHNDHVVVSTMMVLKGGALWALLRWWQQPQPHGKTFLYLGAFLAGLGITDRVSFAWLLMALAPTLLLIYGKKFWHEISLRVRNQKELIIASGALALGASVFLAFNAATLGGSFSPMLDNFRKTAGGVDNLAFFDNLYLRLQMLTEVLNGSYLNHFILGEINYRTNGWHFSGSPLSWLVPLAFIYFFAKSIIHAFSGRTAARIPLFLLSMTAWLLLFSCFTPTVHRGHQLLLLYPFPHILAALFVFELASVTYQKLKHVFFSLQGLAWGMILLLSVLAVRPVMAYHHMLQQTGGRGVWSDAIYDIIAEVDHRPDRVVVCMDWGFNANILSLTKNRVRTIRNYYDHTRRRPDQLAQLFDSTHVFLLHAPEYSYLPAPREDFFAAVTLANAKVDTLRVFYQREGQAVAYLLQVTQPSQVNFETNAEN